MATEELTKQAVSTEAVAARFYELAQLGDWHKIQDEMFDENARSIEPPQAEGLSTVTGLANIKKKAAEWDSMIEQTHGGYCSRPQVAGNFFCCTMGVDVTMKGQGRMKIDEVAVYEVRDGKIVSEQFFY